MWVLTLSRARLPVSTCTQQIYHKGVRTILHNVGHWNRLGIVFVQLVIANHEDCRIRFQEQSSYAKVLTGQSEGLLCQYY